MSKLVFAVERMEDVYDEGQPLTVLHWQEIAKNKHLLQLNPDIDLYSKIDKTLLLITARHEGVLVGYFLWMLVQHVHYKHVLVAEEDLHYLLPEHRRGLNGYFLVKAARDAALERGAQMIIVREKIGHEHTAMMRRLGFKPTDIVSTYTAGGA